MLSDAEPATRALAANALGMNAAQADLAVPALMNILNDAEEAVVLKAVSALGMLGSQAAPAGPALIKLMQEQGPVADAASKALTRINAETRGIEPLVRQETPESESAAP